MFLLAASLEHIINRKTRFKNESWKFYYIEKARLYNKGFLKSTQKDTDYYWISLANAFIFVERRYEI
ncbi:hypothetical protein BpHYR1_025550 [Brachionus plicatilis]|uniref:Uncharacterized protein n=1 Tax=Brachionus plicatilis TaxID=10195 RepID=A0A3M7R0L5_BRAPC|nr:hypothetical protein BpHYR1_025550 [Brachionus plicatilis]